MLVIVALGAACSKEPAGSAKPVDRTPAVRAQPTPPPSPTKPAAKPTPAAKPKPKPKAKAKPKPQTIATAKADLDGDGTADTIEVRAGRMADFCAWSPSITINGITVALTFKDHELQDMFADKGKLPMSVVDVDRKDKFRELLLGPFQQCGPEYDNNGSEWLLLRFDGKRITKVWRDNTRTKKVRFDGSGRWTVERDQCLVGAKVRHEPKYKVLKMGKRRITRYRWRVVKGKGVAKKIRTYHRAEDCMSRFCPHVYVGSPAVHVGEILRDARGQRSRTTQSLRLPQSAVVDGQLTVRLRELERETTYLDRVWLQVGETRIAPSGCSQIRSAWCAAGGRAHVMRHGDELVLQFGRLPPGPIQLWASGYYVLTGP